MTLLSFFLFLVPNIANEFKYSPPYTLALTNWVIQPELEIYEFQSLMKASAFIVKAINQKTDVSSLILFYFSISFFAFNNIFFLS